MAQPTKRMTPDELSQSCRAYIEVEARWNETIKDLIEVVAQQLPPFRPIPPNYRMDGSVRCWRIEFEGGEIGWVKDTGPEDFWSPSYFVPQTLKLRPLPSI